MGLKIVAVEREASNQAVTAVDVLDLDLLVDAIRGTFLDPCLLGGRFRPSTLRRVVCPEVCLDLSVIGPAMLFTGAMPRDRYTLSFISACPGTGRAFNFGMEYGTGHMGFFPPGAPVDSVAPARCGNAILTIPVERFHEEVAFHCPEIPQEVLRVGEGFRVGTAEQEELQTLLGAIEETISHGARGTLSDPRALRALETDLIAAFLGALRSGCGGSGSRSRRRRIAARFQRMDRARDYLASREKDAVSVDDIARAAGLSQRGLENLFRDFLGVTPHAFLLKKRLCGANRDLGRAAPVTGAVKRAALDWGFWHLGRFARDYRAMFGENPSETLGSAR